MLRSLGLGLGLETFAKFLRVSVLKNLVSEKKSWLRKNLVSEKKSRFRFWKNLVSEKSLGFGNFGIVKKVSVSVSVKILVSSFSGVNLTKKNRHHNLSSTTIATAIIITNTVTITLAMHHHHHYHILHQHRIYVHFSGHLHRPTDNEYIWRPGGSSQSCDCAFQWFYPVMYQSFNYWFSISGKQRLRTERQNCSSSQGLELIFIYSFYR